MEQLQHFIKNNLWAIVMGALMYSAYLYFTFSGNRICDCERTEKYSSSYSRNSVNRFYHK